MKSLRINKRNNMDTLFNVYIFFLIFVVFFFCAMVYFILTKETEFKRYNESIRERSVEVFIQQINEQKKIIKDLEQQNRDLNIKISNFEHCYSSSERWKEYEKTLAAKEAAPEMIQKEIYEGLLNSFSNIQYQNEELKKDNERRQIDIKELKEENQRLIKHNIQLQTEIDNYNTF